VELLGLGLEFLKTAFGVDIDSVLGVFANVELGFELLGRLDDPEVSVLLLSVA
jgi:hypothetical protein